MLETRLFMNKQNTPKQYKTTNKLKNFFQNKGVQIISLLKILRSKTILSKMSADTSKYVLWLRIN